MGGQENHNIDICIGKSRWMTHVILIVTFQVLLYSSIMVSVYAVVTLNFELIACLLLLSWVQSFVTKSDAYIKWVNTYIHPLWYFKRFQRIYDEPVFQEQTTMFCYHPHSVLSYFVTANLNADSSRLSKARALGSRFILSAPIFGIILRLWGISAVNPENMKKLMHDQKVSISLVPGGYEEATLTTVDKFKIFIKQRKGFIKYALKYGYTIRPTIVYNQHKAFKTFTRFQKFRLMLNKLKLPAVIFGGGFLWFFLPLNLELVTIVGKGLKRNPKNQGQDISQEEIDQMHADYIAEIQRLHAKYREQFGESQLVIY